ncbi:deoxyguanosinetriphosphate triphosphohydrolase [Nitratifractor sp.]
MTDPYRRFYPLQEDFRAPFARDRDRVLHCGSFRRLEYKTQVFLNHEGDYFRTRLTHSLEVSQIARTLARQLGLDEALAEVIALSHDLGHTPFGHVGGDALDRLVRESGHPNGFEHNFQSFRVVTTLEKRYKAFDGLNLTFATLEGILKHSPPYDKPFFPDWIRQVFALDRHPSLEAMIVDHADAIAYTSHDIDDGIKYGLIAFADLEDLELSRRVDAIVRGEGVEPDEHLYRHRFVAGLIRVLVEDLIAHSRAAVETLRADRPLCATIPADEPAPVGFSPAIATALKRLKKRLYERLYRHEHIVRNMYAGKRCVEALYRAYTEEPDLLPVTQKALFERRAPHRVIADTIASMTDRFAMKSYHQIYGLTLR